MSKEKKKDKNLDEIYLRIWEKQQDWTSTRWSIVAIFIGISFAAFGLSFQPQLITQGDRTLLRLAGFVLYLFSSSLFHRYKDWSIFLRNYLEGLENQKSVSILLQSRWKKQVNKGFRKWTSTSKLINYFGLLYALAIGVLWYIEK